MIRIGSHDADDFALPPDAANTLQLLEDICRFAGRTGIAGFSLQRRFHACLNFTPASAYIAHCRARRFRRAPQINASHARLHRSGALF